mmetsp:Transcript_28814/g.42537  ORF Transcript_28814/g.42537 Transcript_28814/m.42537 type:complete len:111 (+) Transcript_28814:82-414(+)
MNSSHETPAEPKPNSTPPEPTTSPPTVAQDAPGTVAPVEYTQSPAKNSNDPDQDESADTSGAVQFTMVTGALVMVGSLLGVVLPRLCRKGKEVTFKDDSPEVDLKYIEMS